jgi:hypothetical protein
MVNNSTNINKMNSHLSSQVIDHKKGQGHMTLEIQIPACDRNKNEAGLNLALVIYRDAIWSF